MRLVVAALCGLVLSCAGASAADADGIVPAQGPWHATTSVGLPVSFEVGAGQVLDPRFRFKWNFCGTFEEEGAAPVPIEADGHWRYVGTQGVYLEATFVAPDRAEGTVTAPERMLPGCPETHASFVAEPGAAPFAEARSVVRADVRNRRLVHAPRRMVLKRDGSIRFYGLHWRGFGEPVARATGRAYLRSGSVVRRPRVTVALEALTQQSDQKVYLEVRYSIHGTVPPGFRHRGGRLLE